MWRAWLLLAVGCNFRHGLGRGDADVVGDGRIDSAIDSAIDAVADASPIDLPANVIVLEQSADHHANNETSVALHYPNSQLNKSLNVVIVGWVDVHTVTVSDGTGNTYQLAGIAIPNSMSQSLYYSCGVAGTSTNTVTVTFDSPANGDVRILEYSGIRSSGCFDRITSNLGSTTAETSGTTATTQAPLELLVASNTGARSTTAGDPTFVSRGITSFGDIIEDKVVGTTGDYSAGAMQGAAGDWVMQIATFVGK
jgi:hypothetical protein